MKFTQGRALIIGIANYEEISSLPEAVRNDARDIAELLRSPDFCGYPDENVAVLIDEEATLGGIQKALSDLISSALPGDTVTVYFSGHGTQLGTGSALTSALVPYDCKLLDIAGTTLGEGELSATLDALKVARLLVIVDACHAAGAATFKAGINEQLDYGFDEKSLQRLASGTGRVALASSRASETSIVMQGARNSVFTTAVISGLKGSAPASHGTIKVFDLFNHVSEAVRQAVPGKQHPIFKASELEENFPVALALGGSKAAMLGIANVKPGRSLEEIMPDLFPAGPTDQDIWLRAGGDVSRLRLGGTGRAEWFSALRTLGLGGGGAHISRQSLINATLEEFPNHQELKALK